MKSRGSRGCAGFTLIELLVVMGIMVIVSAMIFANFPKLNQEVYMDRAARELVLALRDAQARAVSITKFPNSSKWCSSLPISFPNNYGIQIAPNFGPTVYTMFSDFTAVDPITTKSDCTTTGLCTFVNGQFTCDHQYMWSSCGSVECVQQYTFNRGIEVSEIKVAGVAQPMPYTRAHILFYRPDPKTEIWLRDSRWPLTKAATKASGPLEVKLEYPGGASCRKVTVWETGQISTSAVSCL